MNWATKDTAALFPVGGPDLETSVRQPTFHFRAGGSLKARLRGFTLVELLVGLAITAVTAAVLAILINATAMGTNSTADGRRNLVRLQMIKAQLQDEFVNTRAILATGSNYIVYWIGDQPGAVTPANGAVNFSELRLLQIDASGNLNVYCCKWPNGFSNSNIIANDPVYAASSNWLSLAQSLIGTTYYGTNTLASGATALTTSLDSASPTAAKYVHLTVTLNDGTVSRQLVLGVALANQAAPW